MKKKPPEKTMNPTVAGILSAAFDGDESALSALADIAEESGHSDLAHKIRHRPVVLMVHGYDTVNEAVPTIEVRPEFADMVAALDGKDYFHSDRSDDEDEEADSNILHAMLGGDGDFKVSKRLGKVITKTPLFCRVVNFWQRKD